MKLKKMIPAACMLLTAAINAFAINYTVEGQVEGMDGKMLYMRDYDKKLTIDSALVSDGHFQFSGNYERPAFVRVGNGRLYANCVLDTLAVIDFNSHCPSSGSLLNRMLLKYVSEDKKMDDELKKFGKELKSHGFEQPEYGEIYEHLYNKVRPKKLQLYYKAIADNPNGVGEWAIMALGNFWNLTPEEWDVAYAQMTPYLKERALATYFNDMYTSLANSQPGKPFIDFSAKTVEGTDVKLSDYAGKGKYVLIDFWASWCRPCREEAETTLCPLYEKYKNDERFSILGVATWDKHDTTIAALEKLKYPWPQIIDADMAPMQLYGFNSIPMLILLGPDGTILARDLRGEELSNAVDAALRSN